MPARPDSKPVPNVRVRRAEARDLAALVELENRTFDYDRMSARQWRRHLGNASAEVLVAAIDGAVAGSAVAFFREGSDIARLYSIAVGDAFRGRGLGERLLGAVEAAAKRRGAARVRLEVRADNAGAQRLYEKRGYRKFGLRRAYYEDGHDALRYEKVL